MISYRYLPAIKSAAFKKIAARSAKGIDSQKGIAVVALFIAFPMMAGEALQYEATVEAWSDGFFCVDMLEVWTFLDQFVFEARVLRPSKPQLPQQTMGL